MLKLKKEKMKKGIEYGKVMEFMRVNKHFIDFVNKKPQHVDSGDLKKYVNYVAEKCPQKLKKVIPALSHFYG